MVLHFHFAISDEDETPPVFKAIAKRFEKYFLFGRVVKPTSDDLRKLGLGDMYVNPPELFIIVTQNGKPEKVNAIKYDTNKFGNMNYTAIMQFLFAINGQFRYDLPGNNMAEQQQEAEMDDIIKIEEKRFEILRGKEHKTSLPEKMKDDANGIDFKITKHVGMKDEL